MENIEYITYIGCALIFLIYSIISYINKNIIYSIRSENMSVIKSDYYKLQLLFCLANGILLILESVISYHMGNTKIFIFYYFTTFWLANYLLKFIAVKMEYLNISA